MILYATPPITIYGLIKSLKRKASTFTCMMLKDIWPQEMVDLNIIKGRGILYSYLKKLEYKMYDISDVIGYTSPACGNYLIREGISKDKIIPIHNSVDENYVYHNNVTREDVLTKYFIDKESRIFFYGGNLGRPQNIDYIVDCLQSQINRQNRFFVICGQGTEYKKLQHFFETNKPENMLLLPFLPKEDYDSLVAASDIGMIFLNHKFTVPNCPTRFYAYMEYSKPVLACTDAVSDLKNDINRGNFGWWCLSDKIENFVSLVDEICAKSYEDIRKLGKNARLYLEENFTVDKEYDRIISKMKSL